MVLRNRSFVVVGALLVMSVIGVWSVSVNLSESASPLLFRWVWIFHAPSWLAVNGFFGGIHEVPRWSIMPSIVAAVVAQNVLLYAVGRWLIRWAHRRRAG
jgi:hypothetical protein